ncbi:lipopolysaccharide biosynthesis protein [Ruminococcus gauvreauii]|uniref:lipopolysaccharide biosynthesis protein n=1 Tax=Ruminococcus gauvreauii TaxID=438033 RepID=UPI003984602D
MQKKFKKVGTDFLYNIFASGIVTGIMQLLLYPVINKILGDIKYGNILTVMGIINTTSAVVGLSLNNIRLVNNAKNADKNLLGDYNLLLCIFNSLGTILVFTIAKGMFCLPVLECVGLGILSLLMCCRTYWSVTFRLYLNFKKNFLMNLLLSIGYILGCGLIVIGINWSLAFILGEIFALFYIFKNSDIARESYRRTYRFKGIIHDYGILALSSLSGNLLMYLDRLLLYPLLGASAVAVYTVAAFCGKTMGIVSTPIAGVLLSYYAQENFRMTRKRFWMINGLIGALAILAVAIITPIAPYIIKILYSNLYDETVKIMYLANIAAILGVVSNFIQPAILRFAPPKWQVIKEILYAVLYLGGGLYFLSVQGLVGFCIANIIANSFKIILLLGVGNYYCTNTSVLTS